MTSTDTKIKAVGHTACEWVAKVRSDFLDIYSDNNSNTPICSLGLAPANDWPQDEADELIARANLIVAAPKLLAACRHALTLLEPFDDPELSMGLGSEALTPLKSAVAAAEGKS